MNSRLLKDTAVRQLTLFLCFLVLFFVLAMAAGLYLKARPILSKVELKELLFSKTWRPYQGRFGLGAFLNGTIWVTLIALIIAVPLSIFSAIFLSEYAHKRVRETFQPIIDLLAGISPVIYGVWGVIAIVPLVRDYLMPFCSRYLKFFPFVSNNYTGYSALSAGIVLAVMILPIIISIVQESLRAVPMEIREASLALGASKWQTIKYAVLRKAWPAVVAGIILGLSRAFGETIAVLMVAGCALGIVPKSIFDPAYPIPALIANTYGEMMSVPLYDAAVLMAAFGLLIVTTFFNIVGWGVLLHIQRIER